MSILDKNFLADVISFSNHFIFTWCYDLFTEISAIYC